MSTTSTAARSAAARYVVPWAAGTLASSPVLLLVLLLFFVVVMVRQGQEEQSSCSSTAASVVVSVNGVPTGSVAGYSGAQLAGAAAILQAGADHGVSAQGQTIGVMVAMGESGLTAVDHGDAVGPDSLGWFQQRDAWGPREARLDAYQSAVMFFTGGQGGQRGLLSVPGWETLAPTIAAHRVQGNADPEYYTPFWGPATEVVNALAGAQVVTTPVVDGAGALPCGAGAGVPATGGLLPPGSWTLPALGPTTSPYGDRPATSVSPAQHHNGQDIGAPAGSPVMAAADGVVVLVCLTDRSPCTGYGTLIGIDHGGGVVTRYAHAYTQDVMVTVGQHVTAGQQIARVGAAGQASGPHLHFEVLVNGQFIDPAPWLREHGAPLP